MKIGKVNTFQSVFDIIKPKIESKQNKTLSSSIGGETTVEGSLNKISNNIKDFNIKSVVPEYKKWTVNKFKDSEGNDLDIYGENVWTDGEDIYYSVGNDKQYILNKSTSIWSKINFQMPSSYQSVSGIFGRDIWTDGNDIYYSNGSTTIPSNPLSGQFIFNKSNLSWEYKQWQGASKIDGHNIWTDGENIFYSYYYDSSNTYQYILDKNTSTWSSVTWTIISGGGLYPDKYNIWSDGDNIYYSSGSYHYKLIKGSFTWESINFLKDYTTFSFRGNMVWSDGQDIYIDNNSSYSYSVHCILDKNNLKWISKRGTQGSGDIFGEGVWTDGKNIYYRNLIFVSKTCNT